MGKAKVSTQPWYPGTLETEYIHQYPKKFVEKDGPGSLQERRKALHKSAPLDGISTKQHDYPAWDVARVTAKKPSESPWPKRKGTSATTYNTQFNAKEVPLSRSQAYCELRSKVLDNTDYGTQCRPTYQEDYPGWPGAEPAVESRPNCSPMPVRPVEGYTDYSLNFTNKYSGRPELHKPGKTVDNSIPFSACTTYGKEYIKKPIPPKYNACVDRPWMRCDTCVPSEDKTPDPGSCGGKPERTWTNPPFAIGRATIDDRTEHKTKYLPW